MNCFLDKTLINFINTVSLNPYNLSNRKEASKYKENNLCFKPLNLNAESSPMN